MLKNISNLGTVLNKSEQQSINGGFLIPVSDCCVCTYRPAGSPVLAILTQSCSIPCPEDGDIEVSGDGC